jgi:two-component system chemotaxis response regulator CheY
VLAESKPDLVVLDWDLAILSGEEFIRLARTPATSSLARTDAGG